MASSLPLPVGVSLTSNKVMPNTNGSSGNPSIGFESAPDVGWYINGDGEVVFTSDMSDTVVLRSNYNEFRRPLMINDSIPEETEITNRGILYKKPDDNGLWWMTEDGEVNLAAAPLSMNMAARQAELMQPLTAPVPLRQSNTRLAAVAGTSSAPGYTFENAPTSGMFMEGKSLCITAESIKLNNNVEVKGVLQMPTGSIFTKPGQSGLFWQTSKGEIDLTAKGIVELPRKLELSGGDLKNPTYSFHEAPSYGLTMYKNALINVVNGLPITSTDYKGLHVSGSLGLKDSAGNELVLYKKADSKDLFVKTNESEINITSPAQTYPIRVPLDNSIAFDNLLMTTTNGAIDVAGSLLVRNDLVQFNKLLEIKEQSGGSPDNKEYGGLYKERGTPHLIWSSNGTNYNITKELTEFIASSNNNTAKPEFSFKNDTDTGLSRAGDNAVSLVAGGHVVFTASDKKASVHKPIALADTVPLPNTSTLEGYLYKKAGSAGLYWQTSSGELDLTQQKFPLKGANGSATLPTFAFQDPGYGLYKSGNAVGLAANGAPILIASQGESKINSRLRVSHDNQSGVLSIKDDNLFWNETNLCEKLTYPMKAPSGSLDAPSYSFDDNTRLGITKIDDAIAVVNNGVAVAQFNPDGLRSSAITTNKLRFEVAGGGASGSLTQQGTDLVWKPSNGPEYVIRKQDTTFNGGEVLHPIIAPELQLASYSLLPDDIGKLNITCNGRSVARVADDGLHTRGVLLPQGTTITELMDNLLVKNANGVILQASTDKVDFTASDIGIGGGRLFKSGHSLMWQSDHNIVDLSDKSISFPIKAPSTTPDHSITYGYEGSNIGVARSGNTLVLNSEHDSVVIEDNGYITTNGVITTQIHAGAELNMIVQGATTKLTKDRLETAGVIRGKKDAVVFGYDVADYTVGINQLGGGLGLVSGKSTPAILTDASLNIKHRNLAFNDASLERRGSDLYWKIGSDETLITKPQENWYRETLSYIAGSDIKRGDVICMDLGGSGKVHKGIGGKIQKVSGVAAFTGACKSMTVFDYNTSSYVLAFTKCKLIGNITNIVASLVLMSKETHQVQQQYELVLTQGQYTQAGVLEDGYGKIMQIDNNNYLIASMVPGSSEVNITKLNTPFGMTQEKSITTINLGVVSESMTAEYDSNLDCLVLVCHSSAIQNFTVALVSVGRANGVLTIGSIETAISNISIADINKQLHLVFIPGGTCIVSFGIMKLAFIISGYQSRITAGDPYMDYESVDCADMFYDSDNGVIITLEKTVSGSCYVQILDVLGLNIQKITSKGFNNANIEPLGLAYNQLSGNYAMLYSTGMSDSPVYVQTFDFDGELITFGLRYLDQNGLYVPSNLIKHEKKLFEVPGTKLFIYGYDPNVLSIFETGYRGNPAGYLGVASNTAYTGQQCDVVIKGHIYQGDALPANWLGKKLYIIDPTKNYPDSLSLSPSHGVFLGTCLDPNRVLLGL